MTTEILVRYFHFIAIFGVVSSLVVEHALVKPRMSGQELRRFMNFDAVYGISALLVVAAGLLLWFGVGKPAEFYTKNFLMHTKVTLFIVVGLISIIPSVKMSKLKKSAGPQDLVDIPKSVVMIIRMELLIVFLLPLLASLMAKGVGYFG
ncbi:MAG: DUF2214 family protein [Saprospiraceae bacterium]|nr:DUF2214 family protein [Saprospiraceae bacterium]